MMINTVIFDMDGLMFDTEKLSKKIWKQIGKKYGYSFSDNLFDQMIGLDLNGVIKTFEEHFGSGFPYKRLKKEKNELMLEEIENNGIPIKDGLLSTINYLNRKEISIAIASSSTRSTIELYLESANLSNRFKYMIGGNEVKESKPNPEIFLKCLDKVGANKEETIILEDSINGIKAGNNAGIKVILVPDLVNIPEEIEDLTYKKINSLEEFPDLFETINKN